MGTATSDAAARHSQPCAAAAAVPAAPSARDETAGDVRLSAGAGSLAGPAPVDTSGSARTALDAGDADHAMLCMDEDDVEPHGLTWGGTCKRSCSARRMREQCWHLRLPLASSEDCTPVHEASSNLDDATPCEVSVSASAPESEYSPSEAATAAPSESECSDLADSATASPAHSDQSGSVLIDGADAAPEVGSSRKRRRAAQGNNEGGDCTCNMCGETKPRGQFLKAYEGRCKQCHARENYGRRCGWDLKQLRDTLRAGTFDQV